MRGTEVVSPENGRPGMAWADVDPERRARRRQALLELVRVPGVQQQFEITGECMLPHLAPGQVVQVSPRRFYLPGDVVALFGEDERILAHRLLGYRLSRAGWQLVTGSDQTGGSDTPVPIEHALGVVRSIREGDGFEPFDVSLAERVRASMRFCRLVTRWLLRRLGGRGRS